MTATQHFAAIRVIAAAGAAEASIVITDAAGRKRITINQTGRAEATATTATLTTLAAVAAFIEANTDSITAIVMPIYGEQHNPETLAIASYQLTATRRYALLAGAKPAPVIEAIAEVIEARLHTIDSSLGAATIEREKRLTDSPVGDLFILISQSDPPEVNPENFIESGGQGPAPEKTQRFELHLHSLLSDASPLPAALRVNMLIADTVVALARPAQWHEFDGHAVKARFDAEEPFITGDGVYSGATLPVLIDFVHAETNPYVRR